MKAYLKPSERFTFNITAVSFTPKTEKVGKYITLTLINAVNPFLGITKLSMFADGAYKVFFDIFAPCLAKAKTDGKGQPTAEDGKASIVLRGEELTAYVEDQFLHVTNAGMADLKFDRPMIKRWSRDIENVCVGKNSDGTPKKGTAKKGDDVYDQYGNLSIETEGCKVFLAYMSKDGDNTQPITPYAKVIESALSRYRPITPVTVEEPTEETAEETAEVSDEDIL